MYVHFEYKNGGNPYIATTDKGLLNMILKYDVTQTWEKGFVVEGERPAYKRSYRSVQEILRSFAIEWQYRFGYMRYSWSDIADWQGFFEEMGRRYGLIREFRENCIC